MDGRTTDGGYGGQSMAEREMARTTERERERESGDITSGSGGPALGRPEQAVNKLRRTETERAAGNVVV